MPHTQPVNDPAHLARIAQVAVNARDLPRAVAFWRDVLGLKLLFEAHGHMAFFDVGGTRVMLALPEKKEFDHPSSILYFAVQDIRAAHVRLVERGVAFRSDPVLVAKMPDHELWMAFFTDSEGNTLALSSEVRN
ncbi:MAG: VOC family protein [Planctomycetes bacterium]|nr:VOC family protein [Planctomycetota bacterium]